MIIHPALSLIAFDSVVQVTRAEPTWLWTVEGAVVVAVAVLLMLLLGALTMMAWRLSRAFERVGDAVERFRADLLPVTERAAAIADHLEDAASQVQGAVSGVTETIHSANEALRDAVATADERFREFDAIVRVARDEAEDAVVGAASVIRGVRGGASAFRRRSAARAPIEEGDEDREPPAAAERRRGGPRARHQRTRDAE